eukprot:jgi/Mesvir1/14452/Mv11500-RA.1
MAECVRTTLFVGNLDGRVDERLLYELFLQSSPVVRVHIPRDKGATSHKGYGFVELPSAECAEYARALLDGCVRLYGREVRIRNSGAEKGKDKPNGVQGADGAQGQVAVAMACGPGMGPLLGNAFGDGGLAAMQQLFEMQLRQRISLQQAAQMRALGMPGSAMGALPTLHNGGSFGDVAWMQQQQLMQMQQPLAHGVGLRGPIRSYGLVGTLAAPAERLGRKLNLPDTAAYHQTLMHSFIYPFVSAQEHVDQGAPRVQMQQASEMLERRACICSNLADACSTAYCSTTTSIKTTTSLGNPLQPEATVSRDNHVYMWMLSLTQRQAEPPVPADEGPMLPKSVL